MDEPERSEERRLVAEARQGSMTAFETLVKTHQRLVYAICRRMAGSHQAADDLAQETFVKAYFALSGFKEGLSFVAWLRTIAVNTSLNYLRLRKKEVSLDALGPDGPKAAPVPARGRSDEPADEVARREAGRKFREAVDALPPEQKSVFQSVTWPSRFTTQLISPWMISWRAALSAATLVMRQLCAAGASN